MRAIIWAMYKMQLQENMPALTAALFELYGDRWDFYLILERLEKILAAAYKDPYPALKDQREPWFLSNKSLGTMLYVDLFSGNIKGLA